MTSGTAFFYTADWSTATPLREWAIQQGYLEIEEDDVKEEPQPEKTVGKVSSYYGSQTPHTFDNFQTERNLEKGELETATQQPLPKPNVQVRWNTKKS